MILCCTGRRVDFVVPDSILVSLSPVTVIAGLPSDVCPDKGINIVRTHFTFHLSCYKRKESFKDVPSISRVQEGI